MSKSSFPILVRYTDGSEVVVKTPKDIRIGVGFHVIEINTKVKK